MALERHHYMEHLQVIVFYVRHFLFNIADVITNLFLRQGIEITVFPSDVALIIGLVGGYLLNPSFNKKARNSHSNLRSNLVWDG